MKTERFSWDSTPVINIPWMSKSEFTDEQLKLFQDECMAMHRILRPPVQSLKTRLGKQNFTWVGEYRFWVWEGENWRVYASNAKGICFEVRETLSVDDAFKAWQDFRVKTGISKIRLKIAKDYTSELIYDETVD